MIRLGYGRGRLPLHPRPLPHEALSSWLDRVAAAYGLKRSRLLHLAFDADRVPSDRELDLGHGPPGLATALSERTGVPSERIHAMTLAGYVPKLIPTAEAQPGLFDAYVRRSGWLMPTVRWSSAREKPSGPWAPWHAEDLLSPLPRCCSQCLVTDDIPYVRLHWRLAWMASCPLHGEMLVPLSVRSWLVQFLRQREPSHAAPDLLALDRITLAAATTGMAILPHGSGQVPGGAWLRALRTLLDEVAHPMVWSGHLGRAELTEAWPGADGMPDALRGCQSATFEQLPPERRGLLLQMAGTAVQCQADRPTREGPGTELYAYVMQCNADAG